MTIICSFWFSKLFLLIWLSFTCLVLRWGYLTISFSLCPPPILAFVCRIVLFMPSYFHPLLTIFIKRIRRLFLHFLFRLWEYILLYFWGFLFFFNSFSLCVSSCSSSIYLSDKYFHNITLSSIVLLFCCLLLPNFFNSLLSFCQS